MKSEKNRENVELNKTLHIKSYSPFRSFIYPAGWDIITSVTSAQSWGHRHETQSANSNVEQEKSLITTSQRSLGQDDQVIGPAPLILDASGTA